MLWSVLRLYVATTTNPKVEEAVKYVVLAGMKPLYVNNYARGAASAIGSWMIVASSRASRSGLLALEAPTREPLALMGPEQQ